MSSFEELFNASSLEVVAPQSSLEFPSDYHGDEAQTWLSRLHAESTDRKAAFFDENIDFLLLVRFPGVTTEEENEQAKPPANLLSFLAHLQIAYDASYISPSASAHDASAPAIGRPPVPPRNASINKSKPATLLAAVHPSIFPPSTPNPIPSAAEPDRQYVQVQGTPLASGVWGEQISSTSRESSEAFALLWARKEREWVAVYRMSVLVRYMTTKSPDPLLSLTVSTTLRERPLPVTPARKPIALLMEEAGGPTDSLDPASPVKPNGSDGGPGSNDSDDSLSGFVEVNLLEGLNADPTFASSSDPPLNLPSTRLGPTTRRTAFSLPSLTTSSGSVQLPKAKTPALLSATNNKNARLPLAPASATFRKSYRKTMKIVSGFHVRMRTVFVPYFLLPQNNRKKPQNGDELDTENDEDEIRAREQREAGNEEHTVVLSVEIENLFEDVSTAGIPKYSFEVQRADVSVSGTGAKTALVGWGDREDVFPVRIGPREQVNLLYAVSFLRSPEVDEFAFSGAPGSGTGKRESVLAASQEMRRSVSINISVRPFEPPSSTVGGVSTSTSISDVPVAYPTRTYASYWSCKLNFSTTSGGSSRNSAVDPAEPVVLPTPASPFPTTPGPAPQGMGSSLLATSRISLGPGTSVAGNRRFTFSALDSPIPDNQIRKAPKSPINYQGPTAMLNPANQPQVQPPGPSTPTTLSVPGSRASFIPPSVAFQSTYLKSPTTYNLPSPHDSYFSFSSFGAAQAQSFSDGAVSEEPSTPRTPAYPAYPASPPPVPPTPFWQAPLAQQTNAGSIGPSVEMRRDRGSSLPTPGVNVIGFPLSSEPGTEVEAKAGADSQPIVVSVGLLPIDRKGKGKARGVGEIYPLDQFTLDIFVFNQSSWTRRFEVSHPEERRRRRIKRVDTIRKDINGTPGILPLENRVRVGPLLPSTCQSVRMDFLALTPGVHPIEELILTDIQTGYTMHLRSVMDVVVHEPDLEPVDPS
ncbi:hypothetical protein POSPLADRAFT_1131738 [Postia placenta MAD-698-R-SB12]|uniref:Trafficking protein particle complex II-specific subunit 65 IgD3 domain-containing protein n=1 Tax=Postia placenta MAD-698-R-SB12 TaxID=670580 RepID=A0A1X6NBI2_9APHY|nr:hypothetical protein POSPLADRAFT_1131738 [Postia placenta MAD-698-R-SB12]OSX65862.1 hypothetical protein POSPLADRAFT_1131738 [Postia placenta MAD-698-R-SB12]